MDYNKFLITGGAGFIGSNVAINLKKDFPKSTVIVFDNLKRIGSHLNLKRLKEYGIIFIHGDIRNKEDFETPSFDIMIECSAETSAASGYNGSTLYALNTNLQGTINCLEHSRINKADIVFLSTSRVYPIKPIRNLRLNETQTRYELCDIQEISGVTKNGIDESFSLNGARSLYGASKLSSELIIQEYIEIFGIKGIINRLSCVSGPWQMGKREQGVVAYWMLSHIFEKSLKYIGYNGKQVRDVLHIDDLYNLLILEMKSLSNNSGQILNVGGGIKNSFSLIELSKLCQDITGKKVEIQNENNTSKYDIPYFVTNNSKVSELFKWHPEKTLKNILSDINGWVVHNKDILIF